CGTGTIGILASKNAKKVIGIELNSEAIKDANKNKELNKINNIEFYSGDVGKILTKNNYNPQVIIVDPPRAGLDSTAINQILKIKPERLVYVSCDLMTLTRDLKILSEYYNVLELTPVDMFPMTAHVESVVKLKLKK
ncbi:MAG: class I SAM-dependent RNA methyltransferase, partial [Bacilli bacterium]|nr:class I SAM-dependent RNA methyltransferase [Bacilli bacterium]